MRRKENREKKFRNFFKKLNLKLINYFYILMKFNLVILIEIYKH